LIHLFWATCRPEMMKETYRVWMERCVHPENISIKIAISDPKHKEQFKAFDYVTVVEHDKPGVVFPLNAILKDFKANDKDIMIVPSDDFYPPTNWDFYLEREAMENFNGVLKINDGHISDIIALPIMRYSAYVKMGRIIYHPAYNHMFCDKELHDTAQELGICKGADKSDPLWEHKHPHFDTRASDLHDKRNNADYKFGKEIYTKRRYMTLAERMKA